MNLALSSRAKFDRAETQILETLENIVQLMVRHGTEVKAYSNKALNKLRVIDDSKKHNILNRLKVLSEILACDVVAKDENARYPERKLVERALRFNGLKLKHNEFWDRIERDELIEIYNNEDIQIFRTLNFFRTSSYSLLDLLLNEWFQLWERPSSVLDKMFSIVGKLRAGELSGVVDCELTEHMIKEIYNTEDSEEFISRSSLCRFGVVCPLYSVENDELLSGMLVTARVIPVGLGEETKSISFI